MEAMENNKEISTESCRKRFSEALRLFVGKGRKLSKPEFALIGGFDADAVDNWIYGETMPCVAKLLRILAIVDEPYLVNAIIGIAGFGGAVREEELGDSVKEGLEIASVAALLAGDIAQHRSDGKVTPQEEVLEMRRAEKLLPQLMDMVGRIKRKYRIGG